MQATAELKQANAGLVAKNEVLERQVKETQADYKQELQILDGRYMKALKDFRADSEARTKCLEQDISKFKAKVSHLQISTEVHNQLVSNNISWISSLAVYCMRHKK